MMLMTRSACSSADLTAFREVSQQNSRIFSAAWVEAVLLVFGFFSMNFMEPLVWTGLVAVVVAMVRRNEPRLWLAFGALAGLGLQAKHTVVRAAAALVIGLALSASRRLLLSRWLVGGGLLAFVLVAPNLLWQAAHGWPSLEFYRNADLLKNLATPPLQVVANQVLFMNPVTAPLVTV